MRIDVFSIFPDMVGAFAAQALLGKAQDRGLLDVEQAGLDRFESAGQPGQDQRLDQ